MNYQEEPSDTDMHSSDPGPHFEEPTDRAVEAAAKEALKLDQHIPCERFSGGTHHAVYSVGDDYIARLLPSCQKHLKYLQRDEKVQSLARKYIRPASIVPEVVRSPFEVDDWHGNLDRKLHGVSFEEGAQCTEKTKDDLARLLLDLRSIPVDDAFAATEYRKEKVNMKARVTKAIRAWEGMVQSGHAVDPESKMPQLLKEKLQHLTSLPAEPYEPSFVHGDLNSENIMVNPSDGSVTAVIDWSDSLVGDPCMDESGIIFALGIGKAKKVFEKAKLPEFAIEKAWLYTMTEMIRDLAGTLAESEKERTKGEKHLEVLLRHEFVRVFEGTELVQLLVGS